MQVSTNWGAVLVSGCGVRGWDAVQKCIVGRMAIFGCRNWWGLVWGWGDVWMWWWGNGLGFAVTMVGELGAVVWGVGGARWG